MMVKKMMKMMVLMMAALLVFSSSAAAFDDLPGDEEVRDKVMKLQDMGILNGVDGAFYGDHELTYAEGVHMTVKGLDLSLAAYTFIKAPEAGDYYDQVAEDAWYTDSFIIAAVHGLELGRDVDPQSVMTKEAYTHLLFTALELTGPYPFTKMLFAIQDEADVTPEYMHSIQLMLNGKMAKLDEEGNFHPQQPITREEAAVMLYDTIEFKNRHDRSVIEEGVSSDGEVAFTTAAVQEGVKKVTVSWGERPNPGYGIGIAAIEFSAEDQTATVYYELSYPLPDNMYPQVIVYPEAATYVPAEYAVKIAERKVVEDRAADQDEQSEDQADEADDN